MSASSDADGGEGCPGRTAKRPRPASPIVSDADGEKIRSLLDAFLQPRVTRLDFNQLAREVGKAKVKLCELIDFVHGALVPELELDDHKWKQLLIDYLPELGDHTRIGKSLRPKAEGSRVVSGAVCRSVEWRLVPAGDALQADTASQGFGLVQRMLSLPDDGRHPFPSEDANAASASLPLLHIRSAMNAQAIVFYFHGGKESSVCAKVSGYGTQLEIKVKQKLPPALYTADAESFPEGDPGSTLLHACVSSTGLLKLPRPAADHFKPGPQNGAVGGNMATVDAAEYGIISLRVPLKPAEVPSPDSLSDDFSDDFSDEDAGGGSSDGGL